MSATQLHKAICADCGEECQVPFKPDPTNPAYCPTCYQKRKTQLSKEIFQILQKPNGAVNPVAIVATTDQNGAPHTAPFGSLRAITPKLLRLVTWHGNDTYNNLKRDGRVMVAVQAPPSIAISIKGHAKITKERMNTDANHAIVDITIEEIKNDMFRRGLIQTPLTITILPEHAKWFQTVLAEAEQTP